ncbi:protein kinase domain-containing protein [Candidatus Berkiella aquae]|uniref:Protein kinase n=1 Tax=Candidatus Berkiella aquae TaxID=295108 RepID=A0A0Q9YK84_9GAMM|nr:protein kinase [Candidatus Berkiella aquae]MCS5711253.1 protein kinase [Candidatus Berkiella aquae]
MMTGPDSNSKKRKLTSENSDSIKRQRTSKSSFISKRACVQSNLLNVTQNDWHKANHFFKTHRNETKMSKKNRSLGHSFIRFDNEIIALANKAMEGTLGEGAFGVVVAGQCQTGENCAIKIEGGTKRRPNTQEIQVMRKLQYYLAETSRTLPTIKNFKGNDISSKRYTALSLRKGKELSQVISQLNYKQKLITAIKACEALLEVHDKRVIHADIKANNMIADVKGNNIHVDTVDYDFSIILPKNKDYVTDGWKGTLDYMAPEIAAAIRLPVNAKFSFSSDIYALGQMFILDFKLPKQIFADMICLNPQERCTLDKIILKLINQLSALKNLEDEILQFIHKTKAKYDPNYKSPASTVNNSAYFLGFTHYLKETANAFCQKSLDIPTMAKNYILSYFPR